MPSKNPIIQAILKRRKTLMAVHFSDHSGDNKRILDEAASKMIPRLAYTLQGEDKNPANDERYKERAQWLAYNLLLDISDGELK